MEKKYSLFSADFSRTHPIAIIGLIAFILVFLTSNVFRIISIIIFITSFLAIIILKIQRNREFNKTK